MSEKSPYLPDNPTKFTRKVRNKFLKNLAETGRVYASARAANISPSYVYSRRKVDPDFSQEWEHAMGEYADKAEAELARRAIEGVPEYRYHQGLPVLDYELDDQGQVVMEDGKPKIRGHAYVRRYSDQLLLAHVRRLIPEYNERKSVDMKVEGLEGLLAEIRGSTGLPSEDEDLDDV